MYSHFIHSWKCFVKQYSIECCDIYSFLFGNEKVTLKLLRVAGRCLRRAVSLPQKLPQRKSITGMTPRLFPASNDWSIWAIKTHPLANWHPSFRISHTVFWSLLGTCSQLIFSLYPKMLPSLTFHNSSSKNQWFQ